MREPSPDAAVTFDDVAPAVASAVSRGRLRWAASRAVVVGFVAVAAVFAGGGVIASSALGVVLVALATFAGWRSRAGLLGALYGSAIAAVPLVVGSLVADRCACAGGMCFSWCGIGCGSAAVFVGVAAGLHAARVGNNPAHRVDFAAAAVCCAAAGILCCPVSGVGSVVGSLVGVVVGFSPAIAFALSRKALA